jgi:ABC-type methionine transport system ATPase subunit
MCAPLQPASASRISLVLWLLVLAAVITGSLLPGAVAARIPLAAGRTAILITHRLTTAMRADVIHVMSAGEIVESGTHAELLSRSGLYAQSWLAQSAIPAVTR